MLGDLESVPVGRRSPHPLVAALRDFLGSAYRPYLDSSRALREEWIAAQSRTVTEIRRFFENSETYLYNLVIWHASGNRPGYVAAAIPYLTDAPHSRLRQRHRPGHHRPVQPRLRGPALRAALPSAPFMQHRLRQAGHNDQVTDPRHLARRRQPTHSGLSIPSTPPP